MKLRTLFTIFVAATGAAAGATTAYVISKPKLWRELHKAGLSWKALRVLARHVEKDAHEMAVGMSEFAEERSAQLERTAHNLGKRFVKEAKHAEHEAHRQIEKKMEPVT